MSGGGNVATALQSGGVGAAAAHFRPWGCAGNMLTPSPKTISADHGMFYSLFCSSTTPTSEKLAAAFRSGPTQIGLSPIVPQAAQVGKGLADKWFPTGTSGSWSLQSDPGQPRILQIQPVPASGAARGARTYESLAHPLSPDGSQRRSDRRCPGPLAAGVKVRAHLGEGREAVKNSIGGLKSEGKTDGRNLLYRGWLPGWLLAGYIPPGEWPRCHRRDWHLLRLCPSLRHRPRCEVLRWLRGGAVTPARQPEPPRTQFA